MRDRFLKELPDLVENGVIVFSEPLKEHCSFQIGGPAAVFCRPNTIEQLITLLRFTTSYCMNYFILGRGSNLLISDLGFEGVAIHTINLDKICHDANYVSAYCGVSLQNLCIYAQQQGLSGLEFASGIPGSVGGAVYMNAGAYGSEIKDVLYCSKYLSSDPESLDETESVKHLRDYEHEFSYRSSIFQRSFFTHLSSVFCLTPADPEHIAVSMNALDEQRWSKQPMDLPSGGSVFKRPEGHFTGKLVDDCGLRGYRIGGAAVSEKHCGFIVNLGTASASDVLAVMRHVQNTVFARFGVQLEPELRFIGKI